MVAISEVDDGPEAEDEDSQAAEEGYKDSQVIDGVVSLASLQTSNADVFVIRKTDPFGEFRI